MKNQEEGEIILRLQPTKLKLINHFLWKRHLLESLQFDKAWDVVAYTMQLTMHFDQFVAIDLFDFPVR